jgi:hypothetical protein
MTAGLETPSFRLRPEDAPCRWLASSAGMTVGMWTWGELNPQLRAPSTRQREPSLTPTKYKASRFDVVGFAGFFVSTSIS